MDRRLKFGLRSRRLLANPSPLLDLESLHLLAQAKPRESHRLCNARLVSVEALVSLPDRLNFYLGDAFAQSADRVHGRPAVRVRRQIVMSERLSRRRKSYGSFDCVSLAWSAFGISLPPGPSSSATSEYGDYVKPLGGPRRAALCWILAVGSEHIWTDECDFWPDEARRPGIDSSRTIPGLREIV